MYEYEPDRVQYLNTNVDITYKGLRKIREDGSPPWLRLIAGDPSRISGLLRTKNKAIINELYPLMEKELVLRRSVHTSIRLDHDGNTLSLARLMPPIVFRTEALEYTPEEAAVMQLYHYRYVQ